MEVTACRCCPIKVRVHMVQDDGAFPLEPDWDAFLLVPTVRAPARAAPRPSSRRPLLPKQRHGRARQILCCLALLDFVRYRRRDFRIVGYII